jgi:hypothetical protein
LTYKRKSHPPRYLATTAKPTNSLIKLSHQSRSHFQ